MNGKKAKELRRKAYNEFINLPKSYKDQFTVKQLYKQMKMDLKRRK